MWPLRTCKHLGVSGFDVVIELAGVPTDCALLPFPVHSSLFCANTRILVICVDLDNCCAPGVWCVVLYLLFQRIVGSIRDVVEQKDLNSTPLRIKRKKIRCIWNSRIWWKSKNPDIKTVSKKTIATPAGAINGTPSMMEDIENNTTW